MSTARTAMGRSVSLKKTLYLATALTAAFPAAAADINFTSSQSTATFIPLTPTGGNTVDIAQGVTLSGGPLYALYGQTGNFSITNAGTVSGASTFSTSNFTNAGIFLTGGISPATGQATPVIAGSVGIRLDVGTTITNTGTISGSVGAVYFNTNASPGTIVNSGTIKFTNNASGLITANGIAVLLGGGGTVTNTGYIGGTGALGDAVALVRGGSLTNSGTVDGFVTASSNTVTFTNNQGGTITYNGPATNPSSGNPIGTVNFNTATGTLTNAGTISGKNGVVAFAGATVTNTQTGTISMTNNPNGSAALLHGGTSSISNDGTINGDIDFSQVNGTTIVNGVGDFRLTNGATGAINGEIQMSGGTGNFVTNAGKITGNVLLGQDTPDTVASPTSTIVVAPVKSFTNASTGTVTGTVLLGRGNVLNVNVNGTTLLYDAVSQGVLTNAGTINGTVAADSVNNTGTIKVAAGSLAAISYGNPGSNGYANLSGTFVNSGTVTGNISVQSITNSGTINGDLLYGTDNGLVLPTKEGAIIGGVPTMRSVVATTLVNSGTVNGHIAMANGSINNTGTIAFGSAFNTSTITGSFTQSATGKLTFKINDAGQSDKLVINGAATIAGTLGVAAVDGQWNANRTYTVLTATGGLTGTFSNVDMNVAYLKPSVSYTANDVILAVARSTADIQENVVTETTAQQVSTSSRRVAQAVDARVDEAISSAFVALPSLEQKTSSLPGLISGVNAGDTTNAMWGTWATFTPTFQKQALVLPGQTSAQAVNGTSLSFLAGVDRIIGSRTVVGSFFSYEDSDFDLTGTNGKRSGHGPVIGAYAGVVITNWLNASAQVNHGWFSNSLAEGAYGVVPVTGSFDSQRIMTSETLTAHKVYDKFFNGADVNLSAKLGYSFTRETFDHYTASDGAPVSPGATRLGRVVVGGEAAGWGTAFTPYLQVTYEWDVQTSSSGDKDGAVVGIGGRYRTGSMTFDLYGSTQVGRRQERSKSVGINARYAF